MANGFNVNQSVVHCREGLCTIVSETTIGECEYFIVRSQHNNGDNIFVLKSRTENIIRPLMNIEEAKKLIQYMKDVKAEFMSNTKQRRDFYKKKLNSGNVYDLAFLSKQLYLFHYLNDNGTLVKLGPTDIDMLQNADNILYEELSIVFEKNLAEIRNFVAKM